MAMCSNSPEALVTSSRSYLSTPLTLLSTPRNAQLQLRDVEIVTSKPFGTYRRTGADSRVRVACAPAFPATRATSMDRLAEQVAFGQSRLGLSATT